MHVEVRLLFYGLGIFVCYFYFGMLQEKITRGQYSTEVYSENGEKVTVNERYTYALSLVFIQCLVNYFLSKGVLFMRPNEEDRTPKIQYGSVALTYLLAMVCSNMALQWVAYPTQVVGKAAKPIPVLLLGVLVGKKSYPLKKYLFTFMIVVGVILFMFKNKSDSVDTGLGLGELLIFLSLTMDGLTGAIQERIRAGSGPKPEQMMSGMNAWSCIYLGVAIVLSGELTKFLHFVARFPYVLEDISLLALAGGVGQLFIFSTITKYGPLPCSVITTTRKFFTVLGSVILFGNTLLPRQWLGAVFVFSGLFLDVFFSKSGSKSVPSNAQKNSK